MRPGRIVLLTGPPAAGKSTLARAIAATRERAVVIPIDEIRDWVVAGYANPFDWNDETRRQFRLAHETAARAAALYAREGFDAILEQITFPDAVAREIEPHLGGLPLQVALLMPPIEVALARNETRGAKSERDRTALREAMAWFYATWAEAAIPAGWIRHDSGAGTLEESVSALERALY